MFSIDLRLQNFGDAVGELVVFFDPLPSFGVLDGHDGDTCRDRRGCMFTLSCWVWLNHTIVSLTDLQLWLPASPPAGWQPSWFLQSQSTGPPTAPSGLQQDMFNTVRSQNAAKRGSATKPQADF